MKCVATPAGATKEPRDVDDDGQPDKFVCATHPGGSSQAMENDDASDESSKESGDANEGNNDNNDDDCAKMGCRDLRKHDGDNGDQQEGQSSNDDDQDNDTDDGGDSNHQHEHQGADEMSCPGPAGADGGDSSG
jgi:hypothetical protein